MRNRLSSIYDICDREGVPADTTSSWKAWKTFKAFVRALDDNADPGTSVQVADDNEGATTLVFLHQVVDEYPDHVEPAGGVVWELVFRGQRCVIPVELWSFDYSGFSEFVDAVEQHPTISDLLAREATRGEVYWEED